MDRQPVATLVASLREAVLRARRGDLVAVAHRWHGPGPGGRRPRLVVKVMSADRGLLLHWARAHAVPAGWLHDTGIPHFDLWGPRAEAILHCCVDQKGGSGAFCFY